MTVPCCLAALLLVLVTLAPSNAQPRPWNPRKLNIARTGRDGYLYVPPTYSRNKESPLLIMLHGAGKGAREALDLLRNVQPLLDANRVLVLVPESRNARTWDLQANGRIGPDLAYLQQAIRQVSSQYSIDTKRVALAGHSDGATWALSVLPLGRLFSHVIALSPGGIDADSVPGPPKVFIAHGKQDSVFPIDQTSRRIVPYLARLAPRAAITYLEQGGMQHEPTTPVLQAALRWFLRDQPVKGATWSRA